MRGNPGVVLLSPLLVKLYRRCCLCRKPIPPRKISWCGDECGERWRALSGDSAAIRSLAWKRDHGVCALCGLDAGLVERIADRILTQDHEDPLDAYGARYGFTRHAFLVSIGFSVRQARGHLWEVDHVIPVVEGGTNEPRNLRTLCRPCHARETRALAARRAEAMRARRDAARAQGRLALDP